MSSGTGSTLLVRSERLIVVPLTNGIAQAGTVHLPAAEIPADQSPYMVEARCGLRGVVYVQGGMFAKTPVCPECEAAVPVDRPGGVDWLPGRVACPDCGGPKAPKSRRCAACHEKARPKQVCGTVGTYNRGCRCPDCMGAMRVYHRERRRRFPRRVRPIAGCGTNAMYQRGCRCPGCRVAHSAYAKAYRERAAA